MLSYFYCPALTSVPDYWKNHACLLSCFSHVTSSLPTLWSSPPDPSVHGILQARIRSGLPFPPPGLIVLTIQTFVGKVYLCFLIHYLDLSLLFFQRTSVLISWLQSPSAVILEPKKMKSVTISIVSPYICHQVMGLDAMILDF